MMKFCSSRQALRAVFAALAFATSAAQGQTVTWGTEASFSPDAAQLSDGTQMPESLIWSLGYFATDFVPDADNFSMWAANYTSVHTSFWQEQQDIWSVPGQIFDVGAAAAGRQIYTFAYNDLELIGTAAGEALLFRQDDNLFPGIPNTTNAQIPGDENATLIWGRVDRDSMAAGGIMTGGGFISNPAADSVAGEFSVQTATWAAIPEPASTGLLALTGALCLRRQRKAKAVTA